MADINYTDLKLETTIGYKTFKWGDKDIEIYDYLSINDKYDLVMITLQKAYEDGIYNPIKLDMYFHLNLIYMYTNLIFSDDDRDDESKLYDEMKSSGFIDEFLKNMDPVEYNELQEIIDEIMVSTMQYKNTAASVIRSLIDDLPANAEAAQKIVENFNPEKYQAVVDFAKAANGNREIK